MHPACSVSLPQVRDGGHLVSRPIASSSRGFHCAPRSFRCAATPSDDESTGANVPLNFPDPEAKFRRYGKFFGGRYSLAVDWLGRAPRIRFRQKADRGVDQLSELAILNERLAGRPPWEIRRKVDYLKTRKRNWEMIYQQVTAKDAVTTLRSLEEANRKVEAALSEESRESTSVGDLKKVLVDLQGEVNEAHQKLHLTEARVKQNMDRINTLKREAEELDALDKSMHSIRSEAGAETLDSVPGDLREITSSLDKDAKTHTQTPKKNKRSKGLESSLEMEDGLGNFWYPVSFTSKLDSNTLIPFDLLDEPWVLFRDENGSPACVRDECAHRAAPISAGTVKDGKAVCPYHGWEYDSTGLCTHMPSTVQCKGIRVASLPVAERDGFVWIWPGDDVPGEVPDFTPPPKGYSIHAEIEVQVPVEHGLLLENLLDLAHAPFTHTSTFAKGWPVPDVVKFNTAKLLGGNWEPYPIDMSFEPPCMVVSKIGLAQPGKIMRGQRADTCDKHLHQLHVCLPNRKGEVRLLYRMSLDFLGWMRALPFMDKIWKNVANQVLGEDLVLVQGQQKRMSKGGNTWANPVSYDKLAIRYRRWRNSVDDIGPGARMAGRTRMSAGEMLSPDE
uniref:CAO protein n=1 Tax=Bryopsis plumosa TaxID=3130 RepID=A0A0C6ETB1_BRYPL|nr:chlorophyllide a oxygenase [Bryopsis plumosa]